MVYFAVSLIGLFGIAGLFIAMPSRVSQRGSTRCAVDDWPDVPVDALGLFQRVGRINQPRARPNVPSRVATFEAAQERLLEHVTPSISGRPNIALCLSPEDDAWTDVLLNGALIVQVPTQALVAHRNAATSPR